MVIEILCYRQKKAYYFKIIGYIELLFYRTVKTKILYLGVLIYSSLCQAVMMVLALWSYATVSAMGPFFGWGHYGLEGLLITCSYDYIKKVSLYLKQLSIN